jgi:hypothetical protein
MPEAGIEAKVELSGESSIGIAVVFGGTTRAVSFAAPSPAIAGRGRGNGI